MTYDDLIGVPFVHGGRSRDGLDCYGVVLELFKRRGIALPDPFACVAKEWATQETATDPLAWMADHLRWSLRTDTPTIGCAVVFSKGGRVADHVGVMVSADQFIHALEPVGVVINRIHRQPWCEWLIGFYDYAA